jgi:FimV-like protein
MTRLPSLFKRHSLLATLSLSLLGSAQAFTLSSPQILSRQGDPLRVELNVIEMSVEEQLDFSASLASPEIYKAAQIEMPMNNGSSVAIQINLLRRSNGKAYIQISSKEPISKDFVDLMVDFRWSNGRSLRNIAVALNDARSVASQPQKVSPAPVAEVTTPQRANAPTPAASSTTAPTARTKPAELAQNKSQQRNTDSIRVKHGDTAGHLAAENLPEGVSLEQMLVALLRENPDAFVDQNVNRLKAGSLINMPSQEAARQISPAQAHKEITLQTRNFNAYRAELAEHAAAGRIPHASRDSGGQLEAQVQKPVAAANQDTLKLSKPNGKAEAETKVTQALQAKEAASKAAEISRNIAELNQIAAATSASAPASEGQIQANIPAASQADSSSEEDASESAGLFDELINDPDNMVMGVGALAFLLAVGIWLKGRRKRNDDPIEGLPPVDVKFNIDLPKADQEQPHISPAEMSSHQAYEDEHLQAPTASQEHALAAPMTAPVHQFPDISLDLSDSNAESNPFQVRIDLANELWQLGQQHTSRALMEEVAQESSGDIKAYAQKWLAERG